MLCSDDLTAQYHTALGWLWEPVLIANWVISKKGDGGRKSASLLTPSTTLGYFPLCPWKLLARAVFSMIF